MDSVSKWKCRKHLKDVFRLVSYSRVVIDVSCSHSETTRISGSSLWGLGYDFFFHFAWSVPYLEGRSAGGRIGLVVSSVA